MVNGPSQYFHSLTKSAAISLLRHLADHPVVVVHLLEIFVGLVVVTQCDELLTRPGDISQLIIVVERNHVELVLR